MKNQSIHRNQFHSRGLTLSYLDTAPDDKARPVALFVHGFPDTADMWLTQMNALHTAGYRCIAPDTVGCGESQIAPALSDYNARTIAEDLTALLDHLQMSQVNVVGHDWGAALAWLLAAYHPERVRRLVVLSVGHPMAYARAGMDQKFAGWYIAYFCLAGLAEALLPGHGRFSLRRVFGSHPKIEEVMARLASPGRLTAALRIYRASLVTMLWRKHPKITVPTTGIWSRGDAFLVESQIRESRHYVDGAWQCEVIDGGHWISLEHPNYLNSRLLAAFDD
ncbi:alpha/beta fold hydrolase [Shewanella acanthi]|uniref:alpha/beta fold hydrolase n=1 Tax=Shewanella acanthi TaxID=2864212 RepID=UPI001C65F085|nr:alpha/beta hydrolase [Shewanella acanthi]QYJ80052.1 alpha/beta hydrolase [Shewanella acanthi]